MAASQMNFTETEMEVIMGEREVRNIMQFFGISVLIYIKLLEAFSLLT